MTDCGKVHLFRQGAITLMMHFPGLDPAKVMKSLERFATEVLSTLRNST
jgi:hypothetical protein